MGRLAAGTHLSWGGTSYPPGDNHNALGDAEYFYNRDPELGVTVPRMVDGNPQGAVSIEPPDEAKPGDAMVIHPEVSGLEYPVIARWNDEHSSWDVLKTLDKARLARCEEWML